MAKNLKHGIKKADLMNAVRNIVSDVKFNIQYNHAITNISEREIENIALIAKNCIDQTVFTTEGIIDILKRKKEIYEVAKKVASIDAFSGVTLKVDRKHYQAGCAISNPKILDRVDSEINAIEAVIRMCSPRTVLVVPKNSDKASNAYRKFVTKPVILEIILGAVCNIVDSAVTTMKPLVRNNISYECYGGRFVSSGQKTFKHYILDYNEYRDSIMKTDDNMYAMYFDISKFFQSINIYRLSSILVGSGLFKDRSVNMIDFVSGCFTFPVYDLHTDEDNPERDKTKPVIFNDGLTIETHYQHMMANIYLLEMMRPVMEYLSLYTNKAKIFSYVDDFVIVADTPEMVKIIFEKIKEAMGRYNLKVCEQKTSGIERFGDAKSSIKELVRLPRTNYFEIVSYFFQEKEKEMYITSEMNTDLNEEELRASIINGGSEMYDIIQNKKDLFELYHFAQKLLIQRDGVSKEEYHQFCKMMIETPSAILPKIRDAIRGMIVQHTGRTAYELCMLMKYNPQYLTENIEHLVNVSSHPSARTNFENNIRYECCFRERYSKALMYLYDMQFWINNRERFVVDTTPEGSEQYIRMLTDMLRDISVSEEKLLDTLQQFYLTCLTTDIMTQTLFATRIVALKKIILEKYPAKISFLVGIVRKFSKILHALNMMENITSFTENDEHECFRILSESTNPVEINEAYFAYKYFRYDIIP